MVSSGGRTRGPRPAREARVQGRGVPQSHGGVAAGRGQRVAVGREGQAVDRSVMARQGGHLLEQAHIPELDDAVPAAGRQPAAVGGKRHATSQARRCRWRMRLAAGDLPFLGQVPQPEGAARVADGQGPAVGREGQAEHLAPGPPRLPTFCQVATSQSRTVPPELDGQQGAIGREPDPDPCRLPAPGVGMRHLPPGRQVPHQDAIGRRRPGACRPERRRPSRFARQPGSPAACSSLATSQSRTVLSPLPVATVRPSGANVTHQTDR